jgi:hypothetical protein
MIFFGEFDWSAVQLPMPVALAAVALIGYLVGRRKREKHKRVAN